MTDHICTGCDQPTATGVPFLIGVLCPACDKKWDTLVSALSSADLDLTIAPQGEQHV